MTGNSRNGVAALLLIASVSFLAAAPLLMPDSYSWVANTTSESAAQGLRGAWLARTGFVLMGAAVLWLALARATAWPRLGASLHIGFGVLMIAAAAFSNRPITSGVEVNLLEDTLHSVAATAMGFAFAGGVTVVGYRRGWASARSVADIVAVAASVIVPLMMVYFSDVAGLWQRAMFLIAYGWYLLEALRPERPAPVTSSARMT